MTVEYLKAIEQDVVDAMKSQSEDSRPLDSAIRASNDVRDKAYPYLLAIAEVAERETFKRQRSSTAMQRVVKALAEA